MTRAPDDIIASAERLRRLDKEYPGSIRHVELIGELSDALARERAKKSEPSH